MVSGPTDDTGFVPIDLTSDVVPATDGGGFDPAKGFNVTGGGGSIIGGVAAATVAILIAELIPVIQGLIGDVATGDPKSWIESILSRGKADIGTLLGDVKQGNLWDWMQAFTGFSFLTPLLEDGLGVPAPSSADNPQAAKGLKTVESMVSFALGLQFSITAIQHVGKLLLGARWPETLSETLAKVPEEMGLSWALGLVIDRSFEAAFGESLNNYIRSQIRPNKPEWQIARAMLKQHVIDEKSLDEILGDAGFSADWVEKIKKLETAPLPIGDIQALYQSGLIDDAGIDPLLNAQGFSEANNALLKQLYITKAETASGAELRSVWRTLFRDGLVGESEYRGKLESVNFPAKLIDDDVQAAVDEKTYGWRLQNISVIKSEYLHNTIHADVAQAKLQTIGYSPSDALAMVASWGAPPIRRQHGLTEAQVLKYLMAGVLSPETAQNDLMALGLNPDAVSFLLANPTAGTGAHVVKLTPALVVQAYMAGAIPQDQLVTALEKAGATGDVLAYWQAKALYQYAHHKHNPVDNLPLGRGDVLAAFKHGIYDEATALTALTNLGYSTANATVLLEIENKGPLGPPTAPAFSSLDAAINYLVGLGITLNSPTSPTFESAVSMVEQAGYSLQYPLGFIPPVTNPPIGPPGPPPPQPPGV